MNERTDMKVEVTVKKLFHMEQLIIALEEGVKKYREKADEYEKKRSQQEETINYLTDENDALKQQVESLKRMTHPAQDWSDDDEVLTDEEKQQLEIDKKMSNDLWGFGKDPDKFS